MPSPSAPAPAEPAGPAGPADQHRQSQQGHGHDGHGGQPEQRGQHDQRGQHGLAPVSWEGPATFSDGTPVPQEPPLEDGDEEPDDSWAPAAGDRVSAARAAARAAARGRAPSSPSPAHGAAFSPSSVEDDVPSADDEDAEEAGVVGGRDDRTETTGRGGGADATDRGDRAGPGDRGSVAAAMAAARAAARGEAPSSSGAPAPGPASLEDDLPSEDDEDAEEAGVVGLEVVKRLLGATVLEEITVTQEGR